MHLLTLTPAEYGRGLAWRSTVRGGSDPPWARHLRAGVRDALVRGLEYRAARCA
ncbi:hypothetical protein [Actinacidiphila yeochonensis]|uniref:hypothetical protein n=1 Tax=Actinacidiphila yeochonensis TaxID=89050 RepID=UPI000A4C094F|nr:hypothetical protein [Actinacidiphila yeochonensis]